MTTPELAQSPAPTSRPALWKRWWAITEYVLLSLGILSFLVLRYDGLGPDSTHNSVRLVWWLNNTFAAVFGITIASQVLLIASLPMIATFFLPQRRFKQQWIYHLLSAVMFILGLTLICGTCCVLFLAAIFSLSEFYSAPNSTLAATRSECTDSRYYCAYKSVFIDPDNITLYIYELHGFTMKLDAVDYNATPPPPNYPSVSPQPDSSTTLEQSSDGTNATNQQSDIPLSGPGATANIDLSDELPTIERVSKADFPPSLVIDAPLTSDDPAVVVYQKAGAANQNFYAMPDGDEWILRSEIPCTGAAQSGFWIDGEGPVITFVNTNGQETACGSRDHGITWNCTHVG